MFSAISKTVQNDIQLDIGFIFNINGQEIYNRNSSQKNIVIDMTGKPIGTYIVKLKTSDKQFIKIINL